MAKHRGFSIEQERDGSYSIYRFGYVAGHFATVAAAVADIDRRLDLRISRMTANPIDLNAAKQERDRNRYSALVLDAYDNLEHDDKRKVLDRKAEVQIKARERL